MIVGIVGKVGSGKSLCCAFTSEYLDKKGFTSKIYHCDEVARNIIDADNTHYKWKEIDASTFFSDEKYQDDARKIIHPLVYSAVKDDIEQYIKRGSDTNTFYIIESALPSNTLYEICDKVIYVKCSYELVLDRLYKFRNYSEELTLLILNSQNYYDQYYVKADYIITNDGTTAGLKNKVNEVFDEICFAIK